jgi:hypothetical protein
MARLLIANAIIVMQSRSQKMFSMAAMRLEVLVTSTPSVGRNKKVETMYGALQAIQKYVLSLLGGPTVKGCTSLGQLCVLMAEAAYT